MTLNVTIEALPKDLAGVPPAENSNPQKGSKFDSLGLEVNTLKEVAKQFGVKADRGVIVTAVAHGSIADQNEIKPGDIIEKVGRPCDESRHRLPKGQIPNLRRRRTVVPCSINQRPAVFRDPETE